jgi:hypothetical protein
MPHASLPSVIREGKIKWLVTWSAISAFHFVDFAAEPSRPKCHPHKQETNCKQGLPSCSPQVLKANSVVEPFLDVSRSWCV